VLLDNPDGLLPLAPDARIAVVGPRAADALAMLGCYSFPSHVGTHHPEVPMGIDIPTVLESLRAELPDAKVTFAEGCDVSDPDASGFEEAVARAAEADVCVAVLGDRAGLFGRGTSGEGCDVADLQLPGVQADLLDALVSTGVPVVLVLLTGRPYALGRWHGRLGAVVQAFFPGEEGGPAVTGVLSGRVNPSGRLPVSVPHVPGGQPWTYLQPPLGLADEVSSLDPTPLYAFGHGRSYTTFAWEVAERAESVIDTDGSYDLTLTVRNTGDRAGTEVVQLYLHDPVASVTRPDVRLIAYQRLELAPGEASRVTFHFHPDLSAFTDRSGRRVVEPGALELRLAASSTDVRHTARLDLTGPVRTLGTDRRLFCETEVSGLG
jgi:beta-xylosidase